MHVVTGATGELGRRVVEQVLARVPAAQVAVSVRDPSAAAGLAERGVRVRRGDFTDPASLTHAFEGARRVLVVSAAIRGPGAVTANLSALDAARDAGATRILYTSHQAASRRSLFAPQLTHAATEEHLAGLGVASTALRHGFYASTLPMLLGAAATTGRLVAPADGPVSWTGHDDLAEVDAIALTAPDGGALDAATPTLTAPEALDLAAVAALLGEVVGRRIERVEVSDEQWRAEAVAGGMPEPAADFTLGLFRAARAGEFTATDPTLETVLGRPATSVRDLLEARYGQAAAT